MHISRFFSKDTSRRRVVDVGYDYFVFDGAGISFNDNILISCHYQSR